jgi:hypothetical protein
LSQPNNAYSGSGGIVSGHRNILTVTLAALFGGRGVVESGGVGAAAGGKRGYSEHCNVQSSVEGD